MKRARWSLLFAVWTVPALLSVFETVTFAHFSGHDVALWRAFVGEAPAWYVWALLTPVIINLGERFPLDRGPRAGAFAVHLACSVVAGSLYATVAATCTALVRPIGRPLSTEIFDWLLSALPLVVVSYFSILGVGYALGRRREAEELRAELAVAQLGALRAQLQPHFLFNTLNAITALVRDQETQGALETLGRLSELLRTMLATDAADEVSLGDELNLVERYLGIMQVRFSDRLRVVWDIPDELRVAQVPTLVLQPLVENAIRHGIARRTAAGLVEIAARRTDGRLVLTVRDDGPGPTPNDRAAVGLGLSNTQARLERLYGEAGVTLTDDGAGHGAVATITMPYRVAH